MFLTSSLRKMVAQLIVRSARRSRDNPASRMPERGLHLEWLEGRTLPATLLFVGAQGAANLWTTTASFARMSDGVLQAAASGDTLIFDTTSTTAVMPRVGTNANNTCDIANLQLASLQVASNINTTITLTSTLSLSSDSTVNGGTIAGAAGTLLEVGTGGALTFDFNGGSIDVLVHFNPLVHTWIMPGAIGQVTFGSDVNNEGRVEWVNGFLRLGGLFTNKPGSEFYCTRDAVCVPLAGTTPGFTNLGTLKKVGGQLPGETLFEVPFVNAGAFTIDVGQVGFTSTAKQTASGAMTLLKGSTFLRATYDLEAGSLYGNGWVWGTLNNGFGHGTATVHPGLADGLHGELTVKGFYKQGAAGTLSIEVNAGISLLSVQTDVGGVGGGSASLGGTLLWTRDPAFKPASGSFIFLSAMTGFNGDFASVLGVNDPWTLPAGLFTFVSTKGAAHYWLDVVQIG